MNRYITLNSYNKITSIRNGDYIVEGEIQSDVGELGQIKQTDGSFITPTPTPITPQPTLEDKIDFLYYKTKGVV